MPYQDRVGKRPRPLDHSTVTTIEPYEGLTIYSAPGFMHFIEAMWHGDYQQVPVDPENLPAFIDGLRSLLPAPSINQED